MNSLAVSITGWLGGDCKRVYTKTLKLISQIFESLQLYLSNLQIWSMVKDGWWTINPKSVNLLKLGQMIENTEFLYVTMFYLFLCGHEWNCVHQPHKNNDDGLVIMSFCKIRIGFSSLLSCLVNHQSSITTLSKTLTLYVILLCHFHVTSPTNSSLFVQIKLIFFFFIIIENIRWLHKFLN